MNKIIFWVLFILYQVNTSKIFSQSITIKYAHLKKVGISDTLVFPLVPPVAVLLDDESEYSSKVLEVKRTQDSIITTVIYTIDDTTCAFIGDGFGHEILIKPGDNVYIFVEKYENGNMFIREGIRSPTNFRFSYTGQDAATIGFFDRIAYLSGAIHQDQLHYNPDKETINNYISEIQSQYNARIAFLEKEKLNDHLDKSSLYYFRNEIQNAYLLKLIEPFYRKELSDSGKFLLSQLIGSVSLIEAKYLGNQVFKTCLFLNALEEYALYKKNCVMPGFQEDIFCKLNALQKLNSITIADYLSTRLMQRLFHSHTDVSKSLMEFYQRHCRNKMYIKMIDSLYVVSNKRPKISLSQVLEEHWGDTSHKQHVFKNLFKGKPVLIDCWASWCGPCLLQIPFSKALENEYRGRIDFLYLSFDKTEDKWLKKTKALNLKNSFLLLNNFTSPFAYFFNILSIPHYVLFDKNGKLVREDIPRPSRREAIKKLLDKFL